jgi:hypothetical protein
LLESILDEGSRSLLLEKGLRKEKQRRILCHNIEEAAELV